MLKNNFLKLLSKVTLHLASFCLASDVAVLNFEFILVRTNLQRF